MTKRPSPTGEYAVGTFTYTVYTDREEALEPGTKRKVPARPSIISGAWIPAPLNCCWKKTSRKARPSWHAS